MPTPIETAYRALQVAGGSLLADRSLDPLLIACVRESLAFLADNTRVAMLPITSLVPGKDYVTFTHGARSSRAVNTALFVHDVDTVIATLESVLAGEYPEDPTELHQALYTAAISYPAARDITATGDQKSPGTFLELLVAHLVSTTFGVRPSRQISVPTLDLELTIPTDFVFDLGPEKSRIHLPIKASTRERVIQVWAHQRVLDGMHGVNRFRGLLVVLAETNRKLSNNTVTEVCLPAQWTAYQMYIAQLHRVYYFDVPDKYRKLRDTYPFLEVKPFADFFYEHAEIAQPNLAIDSAVDESLDDAVS